jgi:DNA-binding SARP family transcriptional activator
MQQPLPARAKLTRPRLHNAVARERLFDKLDAACASRPAACVVGPPGAGKTTLVASWSDARHLKGVWYQVDAGDADLATFFFYLGEAARPFLRKGRRALPALTPEYLTDIPGFARRFFRDLFALLPAGACLVLDNYQEVPPEEAFHAVIADAVAEVPQTQSLIVVSRRDPPNCYARLIANENVAFIDWEDLKLTVDETRAIIENRAQVSASDIERLHAESGGWAAGVTLMLEGRRRSAAESVPDPFTERELLFDYFAAQIFARVPDSTRRFLVMTALLPQVPVSVARELTGNEAAGEILESLYQRHLFTHRRPGLERTYWYHALFRNFLLAQADQILGAAQREQDERRAGRLLEAQDALDDAFALFRQSKDWEAVSRMAFRHANELLAQGRGQTLREWILALPGVWLDRDPWLRYWLGTSLVSIDQQEARTHLERAYACFATLPDRTGQALSAAGVLETYYFEWSDFRNMGAWVERLEPLVAQNMFSDAPARELKLYASMLVGILYGAPGHRQLRRCVERVSEMLDENLDVNSKLAGATFLLSYCNLSGELDLGRSVLLRASPLLGSDQVTPLNELWWYLRTAHYHTMVGDLVTARQALDHVRNLADNHGLSGLRSAALLTRSYEQVVACMEGDRGTVIRLEAEFDALVQPDRPQDKFHVIDGRLYRATLDRDVHALCKLGPASFAAGEATGMVYVQVLALIRWAHGLAWAGDLEQLAGCLERVRKLVSGTYMTYFDCEVRFLTAYVAIKHGPLESALPVLEDSIRHARESNFHYPNNVRFSATLSWVLDAALAHAIETDYVQDVVRRYRLRPVCVGSAAWPWPLKLFTLGSFEVQIDGCPLRFSGRTPRKPLALLKAIVALGCADVPQAKLIDALWPEEEGDAGKQSFGVTMVRLRKLLGTHDAITVADERVSLNPTVCWVDAKAFETRLKGASNERAEALGAGSKDPMEKILELYRGPFLPADLEETWAVQMRLRLRTLFTSAIEEAAARMEVRGEWEQAIACYRRGLDADDLIEEFYIGQMRCYLALKRPAEGIATYRRLRQTLSVVLGLAPSSAADAAARALGEAGRPSPQNVLLHP